MARKTNKTDHLLNLLAGSGSGPEDAQQETVKAAGVEESQKENSAGEQKQESKTAREAQSTESQRETSGGGQDSGLGGAPVYGAGTAGKNVHVVRAVGSEDPIAELIKEELETDLNEAMEKAGIKEETAMAKSAVENEAVSVEPEAAEEPVVQEEPVTEEEAAAEDTAVDAELSEAEDTPVGAEPAEEQAQSAGEETVDDGEAGAPAQEEAAAEEEPVGEPLDEAGDKTVEKPQKKPAQYGGGDDDDDDMQGYVFHNMMETIVRDKVSEYIRKFDVCSCKHCKADVIALALSKLPPKYVVVHESALSPLRSFYEDHYAGQIVVEITKACIEVSAHPHHSR